MSLSYILRNSRPTIRCILQETQNTVWNVHQPKCTPFATSEDRSKISKLFSDKFHVQNCDGSANSKHCHIMCLTQVGSCINTRPAILLFYSKYQMQNCSFIQVDVCVCGPENYSSVLSHSLYAKSYTPEGLISPYRRRF